jgi:hypothetical protein
MSAVSQPASSWSATTFAPPPPLWCLLSPREYIHAAQHTYSLVRVALPLCCRWCSVTPTRCHSTSCGVRWGGGQGSARTRHCTCARPNQSWVLVSNQTGEQQRTSALTALHRHCTSLLCAARHCTAPGAVMDTNTAGYGCVRTARTFLPVLHPPPSTSPL